jgi:tRNA-splicing ligase RtcB
MKKLNLQGKDLRRIGLKDDRAASLAKQVMQKHYKDHKKEDALEILKKVIQNPDKFRNHPQLGKISEALIPEAPKQKPISASMESAKPYTIFGGDSIEKGALEQMNTAMKLPISLKGALMPDAHQGYGLPIGGVLATENQVIPYGVGMDIGCRMCMTVYDLNINRMDDDTTQLMRVLENNTRFGKAEFSGPREDAVLERPELNEIKFLKSLKKKAHDQLGTSGHGNHFVDIGILELKEYVPEQDLQPGTYFAILSHSGSRGSGAEIARHYTHIAMDKCGLPKGARSLAWLDLDSEEGIEYWAAMNWAGAYSAANHHHIHERLAGAIGVKPLALFENHHNFAWREKLPDGRQAIIHRKGATPAKKGVLGIIPGSMADNGYLVRGKGNESALDSAAHGAGRKMSRSQAKKQFSEKEMKQYLWQRNIRLMGGGLDESPMAYKDISEVMRHQADIVDILAVFKPRIVRMA